MTTDIYWYLTPFDGHYPWVSGHSKLLGHGELVNHVQHLDESGFAGLLYASNKQDPIVVTSTLLPFTRRLKFIIPIYAGIASPRLLAEQALTFNEYSGDRLILNAVNGCDPESAAYGVPLGHDARYRLAAEYWERFREFYSGGAPCYRGTYLDPDRYSAEDGGTGLDALSIFGEDSVVKQQDFEHVDLDAFQLWGAGASAAGQDLAGRVLDIYLGFLRSLDDVEAQFRSGIEAARRHGREYRAGGIRAGVTVRGSTREAVDYFYDLIETTGVDQLAADVDHQIRIMTGGKQDLKTVEAPDAQRKGWAESLVAGRLPALEELKIGPNIYVGLNPHGTLDIFNNFDGKYIVGSGGDVAGTIGLVKERVPLIDTFILSGWPLLREADYVAEYLLPRL